ncbi:hypothetical protein KZ875_33260, partial [Pseudomonas aeruginosa]|uniref:hypothetical protein n=1 Tax=Pseudomonas aeruginosa TaxID=287 RepID=UPI001CA4AF94
MNTWVSFQSAEQPLLGQFSVSGNTLQGDSHQLMPQRPHGIPYMHHQVIAITPAPWIEIEADFTMVL